MKNITRRIRSRKRGLIFLGALCLWTLMLITKVITNQESIVKNAITIFNEYLIVPDDVLCYREDISGIETAENNFQENSIFVISATCNNMLTLQESCAIESVFRNNNKRKIYVLVTKPLKYFKHYDLGDTGVDIEIIKGYEPFQNQINVININDFVKNTPVEGIFLKDFLDIKARRYKRVREVLKLAALYRFGGVVIDLEMLVARPVETLGANGAPKVSDIAFGSAIMALDKKQQLGKILLELSFKILNNMRNATELDAGWMLTKAFMVLCSIHSSQPFEECPNFQINLRDHFYPLSAEDNYKYFEQGDLIPAAKSYYIWDNYGFFPKNNSLYWKIMEKYCPRVHGLITNF